MIVGPVVFDSMVDGTDGSIVDDVVDSSVVGAIVIVTVVVRILVQLEIPTTSRLIKQQGIITDTNLFNMSSAPTAFLDLSLLLYWGSSKPLGIFLNVTDAHEFLGVSHQTMYKLFAHMCLGLQFDNNQRGGGYNPSPPKSLCKGILSFRPDR
jgi:hypothetical protein